jgi:hypothetical protein
MALVFFALIAFLVEAGIARVTQVLTMCRAIRTWFDNSASSAVAHIDSACEGTLGRSVVSSIALGTFVEVVRSTGCAFRFHSPCASALIGFTLVFCKVEASLAACALVLTVSAASLTFGNVTIVTSANIDLAHVSNLVISLIARLTNVAVIGGTSRTCHWCTTWTLANGRLALVAAEVETRIADGTFEQTVLGTISTLHSSATSARTDVGFASVANLVVASVAASTVFRTMKGAECTIMWCASTASAYVLYAGEALLAVTWIARSAEIKSMLRTRRVGRATFALAYILLALASTQVEAIPAGSTLLCLVCGALWLRHRKTIRTFAMICLTCHSTCVGHQAAARITGCTLPRLVLWAVLTCCCFAEEAGALRRWGWRCRLSITATISPITSVSWILITAIRIVRTIRTIIIRVLVDVFLHNSPLRLQQR